MKETKKAYVVSYVESGEKSLLGVVLDKKESFSKIKDVFKESLEAEIKKYKCSLKEFEGDPEEFDFRPIILQLLAPLEKDLELLDSINTLEDFKNSNHMVVYGIDLII